jgi:FKBP-type peptidyl-prolyl cis-trans isomerase
MNYVATRMLLPALGLMLAAQAFGADAAPTAAPAHAPKAAVAKSTGPQTEEDKTLYSLGVYLSHNLDSFQLSDAEFAQVRAGISDGFHHKADLTAAEAQLPKIQALQKARLTQMAAQEKQAGQAYLAKEATKPGAVKTTSGLLYIPVTVGTGPSPARTDRVKVNYEGRLIDGTVFDSSAQHGGAATLPVAGIIPCWTEALQLMKVGGKMRLVCPAELAYGDRGAMPKIKPGQSLVFDIDLLEIAPPPPAAAATPPGAGAGPAAAPSSAAPAASAPAGK